MQEHVSQEIGRLEWFLLQKQEEKMKMKKNKKKKGMMKGWASSSNEAISQWIDQLETKKEVDEILDIL